MKGFVRRRVPVDGLVAVAVILGVAGLVVYPALAKPGSRHDAQKLAKALKKCEKDKSERKRKKCERTVKAKYGSKTRAGGYRGTGAAMGTGTARGTATATGTTTTGTATATGTGSTRGTGTTAGTGTATATATATGTSTGGATTTTGATHVPQMARLVVHVVGAGSGNEEAWPMRIQQLGACTNDPCRFERSGSRPVELAAGSYEVAALNHLSTPLRGPAGGEGSVLASTTVTLGEGQEREVTLEGAKPIPDGVSVITVNATATKPNFAFTGTISEPQGVSEMIARVESVRQVQIWGREPQMECASSYAETLRVELLFRRSAEAAPVATVLHPAQECESLEFTVEGHEQPTEYYFAVLQTYPLIEKLLGVKFPSCPCSP
jgi:hypothetical protein